MLVTLLNKKGFSLVEALIAVLITAVAAGSIIAMQSLSWKAGSKSDYLGRAAGLLETELELRQDQISRPGADMSAQNSYNQDFWPLGVAQTKPVVHVLNPLNDPTQTVTGDMTFTVTTKVTSLGSKQYLINVQVTWTGSTNGIKSSVIVMSP